MSNKVAGIVLAAGNSSRFGSPKQLLPWKETTVLNSVVLTALETGLLPLIVVIGANADHIEPGLPVGCVIVKNALWSEGQSTSIQAGLAQLHEDVEGLLVLLGDQPQINPHFCDSVVRRGLESGKITIPYINDWRANPVYFPKQTLGRLAQVSGDRGGRAIFSEFQTELFPWLDDCMAMDIDTPEDYEKLKACYAAE